MHASFRLRLDPGPMGPWLVSSPLSPPPADRLVLASLTEEATFDDHARLNGFTPEEAAALRAERQCWGRGHWASAQEQEPAWIEQWHQQLMALRSPIAWHRYQNHRTRWLTPHLPAKTPRGLRLTPTRVEPIAEAPVATPASPKAAPRPCPKGWTAEVGRELLARLMAREGIQGVSWLAPLDDEAETSWWLYEALRRACRQWRHITGWSRLPWQGLAQHQQPLPWLLVHPAARFTLSLPFAHRRNDFHGIRVLPGEDLAVAFTRVWLDHVNIWARLNRPLIPQQHDLNELRSWLLETWKKQAPSEDQTSWEELAFQAEALPLWRRYFLNFSPIVRQDEAMRVNPGPATKADEIASSIVDEVPSVPMDEVLRELTHVCTEASTAARSLNDPATFLVNAAHNGFTPAEAVALYQEKRLFQQHTLLAWDLPEPTWHRRIRTEVAAIRSPMDWRIYLKQWADLSQWVQKHHGDGPWEEMVDHALDSPAPWEEDLGGPLNFDRRKEGATAMVAPAYWNGPWTWMLAKGALEKDSLPLPPPSRPRPRRWTAERGVWCLRRHLRRVGLSGLQWPWARQDVAEVTWSLFCGLRQFQRNLVQVTGWHGPVTGLGCGLWLRLGHDSYDLGSGVSVNRGCVPLVCAAWTHWPVTLAHEWMHMFDAWLSNDQDSLWDVRQLNSQKSSPRWPVRVLLDHLEHSPTVPTDQESWMQAWRTLPLGKIIRPDIMARMQAWAEKAEADGRFSLRAFYRAGFFSHGRHVHRRRNIGSGTFPRLLQFGAQRAWPTWWARCDELQACELRWMDRKKGDKYSWWAQRSERLAVAFEGQVHPIRSDQVWYAPGLPTPAELAQHKPGWDNFFEMLRPDWERSLVKETRQRKQQWLEEWCLRNRQTDEKKI